MIEPENDDEAIIETKGVRVNFGDFWALKGIDIKVRKGEIIVILGPSGSGKSTFIRTLNLVTESIELQKKLKLT